MTMRLVIGGSSCVGKTILARELSERLNLKLIETDRSLPNDPHIQPLGRGMEIWDRPPIELCDLLTKAAAAAPPYLLQQVSSLSQSNTGWIIEGERVHPGLVERLERNGQARGLFIIETNRERLYQTLMERLPGFKKIAESRRRAVAELDQLYNLWLREEAIKRNFSCLESQPWPTLPERVLAAMTRDNARQQD